jgi:tetratricopeptide (TPR) repeat protein
MRRPIEARAAIDEARKAGPSAPESFVAEALLLDRDGKNDEARAAFARAVDAGSTSAYAHYRLASLFSGSDADHDALTQLEKLLSQAVALNNRYAGAYAFLGEVRSQLGVGEPISLVLRAISLEPSEGNYRLRAASVLWRDRKYDDALKHAQAALRLAKDDGRAAERRRQMATRAKEAARSIECPQIRDSHP